ncbi:MAG: TauD/TfdA family dioxygenase [Myxococcota bacterium]
MSLSFSPLSPALGARIHGLDPHRLDETDRKTLREAFLEYGVLLASGLDLSPDEHVSLTRVFGEPDIHPIEAIRLAGHPEIIVLAAGQLDQVRPGDPGAEDLIGKIAWHSDLTYTPLPSRGALLLARTVPPEGGQTGWIDLAAVYDALSDAMKRRIEGLEVVHGLGPLQQAINRAAETDYAGDTASVPQFEAVTHPLVHRHPETGRRVLDISPAFTQSIVGWSEDRGRALLDELRVFATQRRFTYFHTWQPGDLVVWDNWRTMHVATGHARRYRRVMHRTTLRGGVALAA